MWKVPESEGVWLCGRFWRVRAAVVWKVLESEVWGCVESCPLQPWLWGGWRLPLVREGTYLVMLRAEASWLPKAGVTVSQQVHLRHSRKEATCDKTRV